MKPRDFFEHHMPGLMRMAFNNLPDTVTFAFFLEDSGSWQVERIGGSIWVGPIDQKPKDCELHCSSSVFFEIVSGVLNPRRAFLDGRLRLQGDLGLALRLQDVLIA